MTLARVVLALSAVPFAVIGLAFVIAPGGMGSLIGVSVNDATSDNDVRAVYGGLQLGCAAFLALCAARDEWIRPGLAAQVLAFGGLALARIISWLAVGLPSGIGLALHAGEVVGLIAGILCWRRLPSADPEAAWTTQETGR